MQKFLISEYAQAGFPLYVDFQQYSAETHQEHYHDCNEIVFITGGSGREKINDRYYPIIPGDIYIMNKNDTHAFETEKGLGFYNLMFKNEIFSSSEISLFREFPFFNTLFEKDGKPLHKKLSLAPPFSKQFKQEISSIENELYSKKTGYKLSAKARFTGFLIMLLRYIATGINSPVACDNSINSISRAINHIHNNYKSKTSIEELAEKAGVSKNYIGELFRKETGMSITEYIIRLRVDKARAAIDEGSMNLSQISYELGFYDSSYFSRTFKKYTGLTPRQYTKLSRS